MLPHVAEFSQTSWPCTLTALKRPWKALGSPWKRRLFFLKSWQVLEALNSRTANPEKARALRGPMGRGPPSSTLPHCVCRHARTGVLRACGSSVYMVSRALASLGLGVQALGSRFLGLGLRARNPILGPAAG